MSDVRCLMPDVRRLISDVYVYVYRSIGLHGSSNLEKFLNWSSRLEKSLNSINVLEKYLISLLGLKVSSTLKHLPHIDWR